MIHPDHLATPQKMTDSSGTVVWAADYKPFGEVTITVSTITNNLRFPGQYHDTETELNYNYFRDYNSVIGRYVEADPVGIKRGKNHLFVYVDSVGKPWIDTNLYAYAANNPINVIDPLGLFGTQSCTYYEQACQTNGGFYECHIVQRACNSFPKDDDTSNCIRQCLQEKHKARQPKNQCSEKGQTTWSDFFVEHYECFMGCLNDPGNPYVPNPYFYLPNNDINLY